MIRRECDDWRCPRPWHHSHFTTFGGVVTVFGFMVAIATLAFLAAKLDAHMDREWANRNLDPKAGPVWLERRGQEHQRSYKICDGSNLVYYFKEGRRGGVSVVADAEECS